MDYESRKRYGEIIARIITESGLAKVDVAQRAGISARTVSNVTNGKTAGQEDVLIALTRALEAELREATVKALAMRVRRENQAKELERGWMQATAKVEAIHAAKHAIEAGTFDNLAKVLAGDVEFYARGNCEVPGLMESADELGRDLDIMRGWLARSSEGPVQRAQ